MVDNKSVVVWAVHYNKLEIRQQVSMESSPKGRVLEEQPSILIKVFNRDPHKICASLKLSPQNSAAGYFIKENGRPAFALQTNQELYRFVLANVSRFGKVTSEIHANAAIGYVLEFAVYAPVRKFSYYSMPFDPESEEVQALADMIKEFLAHARRLAV